MYIISAMISEMMANPQNARFDECMVLYRIFMVPISLEARHALIVAMGIGASAHMR